MQLIPFHKNRKNLSDEQLLASYLKSHNQQYLGEVYERYIHLVYGVCIKYLKDVEDAKDAVIKIYEKVRIEILKQEIGNFKSWLYVVAKNFCLMELRKQKNQHILQTADENELARFMEKEEKLHPIDEQNSEEIEQALLDCIKRLKDEQKKCIQLFYFENKSYREIAGLIAWEEKKVKSSIQNGKRNLKICLELKNETK
jgi:RNA polymerase sigma-70 factor (ECF subfamily)